VEKIKKINHYDIPYFRIYNVCKKNIMSGKQKVWMWIFLAMFLIPEILFFTTPAMIMALAGKKFNEISSLFINYSFFLSNPLYLLTIIAVEFFGILSLLILSKKSKKYSLVTFLGIILLWLIFIFLITYVTGFSMGW